MESTIITVIIIIIAIGLILLVAKAIASPRQQKEPEWKRTARNKLVQLEAQREQSNPGLQKQVIMDMDKTLDFVLMGKGFKGETMGERLKSAKEKLDHQHYNLAWEAHKERNRLAHEMDYHLNSNRYREINSSFSRVIRQLIK